MGCYAMSGMCITLEYTEVVQYFEKVAFRGSEVTRQQSTPESSTALVALG